MTTTITIPTDTYERLLRVAQDARDVAECNCGPTCEGTCTHGLATTVLRELARLAPKAETAGPDTGIVQWMLDLIEDVSRGNTEFDELEARASEIVNTVTAADVRLMSKAPELLAALNALLARVRALGISEAWPEIDAARLLAEVMVDAS